MIFNTKSEAEKNFETFIPNYQIKLLEDSNDCNFGLFFQRICHWQKDGEIIQKDTGIEEYYLYKDGKPVYDKNGKQKKEKSSVRDDCTTYLLKKGKDLLKVSKDLLENTHINQKEYIDFMNGSEIKAKLVSPFITGLGSGHPTETGMILDRNTGVPYIPASSIKGVLRTAYAVVNAREIKETHKNSEGKIVEYDCMGVPDDELNKIFGGENNSSKVIFLDAYPEKIPAIQSDIMNVHYFDYYNKNVNKKDGKLREIPKENEEPKPIKFLSVKEGCDFVFRYIVKDENLKSEIENAFKIAFETIGFGGKTAIGYGRFESELFKKENTVSEQEKKEVSESNIDELVRKIKPEQVKINKPKLLKAIVSSEKPVKAKIFIKYENSKDAQIFEITVSGISSVEMGKEINVTLNNFNKQAPLGGKIS